MSSSQIDLSSKKGIAQMLPMKRMFGCVVASGLLVALMVLFSPTVTFAASHTPQTSGCVINGATIVDATGTITAGVSGATVSAGTSMNCVKTIAVTAKNKVGSVSAVTFVVTQVNCGISGCVEVALGSMRVAANTTGFANFSASPAGLSSTLTITANADPGNGSDNFHVTVQAYTS